MRGAARGSPGAAGARVAAAAAAERAGPARRCERRVAATQIDRRRVEPRPLPATPPDVWQAQERTEPHSFVGAGGVRGQRHRSRRRCRSMFFERARSMRRGPSRRTWRREPSRRVWRRSPSRPPLHRGPPSPRRPRRAPTAAEELRPADRLAERRRRRSAGLQWVNSDAGEDPGGAGGDRGDAVRRSTCRARFRKVVPQTRGPLVLVETRKDLSQVRLPFESQAPPETRTKPGARRGRAREERRGRFFASGQAVERAQVGRRAHQVVPGQRHGLRQQVEAARARDRVGLPAAGGLAPQQAVEQRVDRGTALPATGCRAAPCRSRRRAPATPPRRSRPRRRRCGARRPCSGRR